MHGPAHLLFRNQVGQDLNFIRVGLRGTRSGPDAFGAVVRMKTSAGVLTRVMNGGGGFLSQSDPRMLFGLGRDQRAEWMEIRWPSGLVQHFDGPEAGASLVLIEGQDEVRCVHERRFQLPDPLTPMEKRFRAVRVRRREHLPDLTVLRMDGEPTPLRSMLTPGRPVLLNFWATWCAGCATEMGALQQLHAGAGSAGPHVLGISVDGSGGRDAIPEFLKRAGVTYPVCVMDRANLGRLFATPDTGVPLSILLDEELRVVDVFQGWSAETRARLGKLTRPAHTR